MMFESKAVEVMAVTVCRCLQRSSIFIIPGRASKASEPRMCNGTPETSTLPGCDRERSETDGLFSALVGTFVRGNLFDQLHNAAPKLGVGDARECAGQRQTL